ncbi:MAG: HAD-IC family P-type ATPase [Candidatus Lokiarchaeota archaeon]|nr:HAD-IC family P-type ATPase [Candidatus Lokiarchaeota archaeon]MBD3337646.1 HAD-IC family P-type ATPase [Candidatus Lokiarchaeota archaeon]
MSQALVSEENYFNKSVDRLLQDFNTDSVDGLSEDDVKDRLERYGFNELPKIKKSIWKIYLAPIFNFLIVILLITGIIVIILGSPESTIITFTVVIVNSGTAIIQQFRAQKALESLRQISALKAKVIRNGIEMEIPTKELLPGDIVLLSQGDKVPADGRIIEAMNLTVDEAPLTGESEPIDKSEKQIDKYDLPIQNQSNMVFMGTYVHTGRAKILITGIGAKTEIGKISSQLNEMGSIEDIPLTKKLNRLGSILAIIVIINLFILIIYKFTLLSNQNKFVEEEISKALVSSILRAMNILPINLPLMTTLILITGVLKMAQTGVIIKNLSAIESLGRVSVICSDKTGTITKNEMTVEKFYLYNNEFTVTGSGYEAEGEILNEGKPVKLDDAPTFENFIDSIVLNNNANLVYEDVKVKIKDIREKAVRKAIGSPTEAALLVLAEKAGYEPYDVRKKYKIISEFSFNSEVKRMTTLCRSLKDDSDIKAFAKGAPEKIIEICSQIEIEGKPKEFTGKLKLMVKNRVYERATQGYRTLAIAYRHLDIVDQPIRQEIEEDLIFLGFVSIMDPPRPGVRESVEECMLADIKVIMITGDHPSTAKKIASDMKIYKDEDLVVEGKEIKNISDEAFQDVTVFARVAPSDKEIIVDKYQKKNKVVAMTGDGINDTLALKMANAGIAMGITGTDVAKETADMIISDDNFTSIEKGVKIGRGLFSKIRTVIYFFICLNIMEAIIFFGYEFIPTFELFRSEWQHIYIYGIVHSFPSLALVIDTQPKYIMQEPPRDEEQILNKNMWIMLLIQAFLMGIGLILAIQLTLAQIIPLNQLNINPFYSYIPEETSRTELTHMKARTMFITTLYIEETMFLWSFRRPNQSLLKSLKEEFNPVLLFICIFTLTLHVLIINFSYIVNFNINETLGLNLQLNFMFLAPEDWLICIGLAIPGIFGIEGFKYYTRKKGIII